MGKMRQHNVGVSFELIMVDTCIKFSLTEERNHYVLAQPNQESIVGK